MACRAHARVGGQVPAFVGTRRGAAARRRRPPTARTTLKSRRRLRRPGRRAAGLGFQVAEELQEQPRHEVLQGAGGAEVAAVRRERAPRRAPGPPVGPQGQRAQVEEAPVPAGKAGPGQAVVLGEHGVVVRLALVLRPEGGVGRAVEGRGPAAAADLRPPDPRPVLLLLLSSSSSTTTTTTTTTTATEIAF